MFPPVFLPLLLIIVAGLSGSFVAYGASPLWMRYPHGLEMILWARRLQLPLVSLSLLACIFLITLAISGRRRAWWLIGLAPVLALFAHRFALGPAAARMTVAENPVFVSADQAKLADEEWVVGLSAGDHPFAYPYAALYTSPVVIHSEQDKRIMLLWSSGANRVLAVYIEHDLKGRDLEVVSTPANALLIYNSRDGEFINGLTGQSTENKKPTGFTAGRPLPTSKTTWRQWRAAHPDTKVFLPTAGFRGHAPTQPIQPAWPMPPVQLDRPAHTRIALVGDADPLAVESTQPTAAPLNARADGIPVAVFREQPDAPLRAFDRRTYDQQGKIDLIVNLAPNLSHKRHPQAFFVDLSSNTGWSAEGVCVDAPAEVKYLKGKRLTELAVDDDLPWEVIKFWYPALKLEIAPAAPIAIESESDTGDAATTPSHSRPHKPKPTHPRRR